MYEIHVRLESYYVVILLLDDSSLDLIYKAVRDVSSWPNLCTHMLHL